MGMLLRDSENIFTEDESTNNTSSTALPHKENIDPYTLKYSPLRKPGSIARKALREITQEHLKKRDVIKSIALEEKIVEGNDDVAGLFDKLNNSPFRMKN